MTHNLKVIEFQTFFDEIIQHDIIDSLDAFKLIDNDCILFRKKEAKNAISYFIVYHITKKLKESKGEKLVFTVQPSVINVNNDFNSYIENDVLRNRILKFIMQILKMVMKSHPDHIHIFKKPTNAFSIDTQNVLFEKCNSFNSGNPRFLQTYSLKNFNLEP